MNPALMSLILALLLISLFSPFAVLSLLMLFLFVAAIGWTATTLINTLVNGKPEKG